MILAFEREKLDSVCSVWFSDPRGWSLRVSFGEECIWADRRILQGLKKEMQQALQLGKAAEGRSGLGASPRGESDSVTWFRGINPLNHQSMINRHDDFSDNPIDHFLGLQWYKLDELFEQERNVRTAMTNRAGLLALMLHQTIQHDPLTTDLRGNKDR